jgi:hypothetical protein
MKTDYKFWYILRRDDVHIDEAAIRFYEGEFSTQNELNANGIRISVTRYRRIRQLRSQDLPHFKKFKKEFDGNETVLFTKEDFGNISTDDELRVFLNAQLQKDKKRIPIDEQNTLDIRKVK